MSLQNLLAIGQLQSHQPDANSVFKLTEAARPTQVLCRSTPISVSRYLEEDGISPFADWFASLDATTIIGQRLPSRCCRFRLSWLCRAAGPALTTPSCCRLCMSAACGLSKARREPPLPRFS